MKTVLKLGVGLLGVVLLAYYCFYVRGHGERAINDITARSNQALVNAGIVGVMVAGEVDPVRRRFHLSGPLPPEARTMALAVVSSVPGVGQVVWDEVPAPTTR